MAKSLFIAPTSMDSGLTSVCLGLLRALERVGVSVGFYKPFCQSVHQAESMHNDGQDTSVAFVRGSSHLNPPDPIALREAQQLLNRGKSNDLLETVVGEYEKVARDFDVVIIEGLVPDRSEAYIARLNVEVARNLGSDVILVSTPANLDAGQLDEELDFSSRLFASPSDPDVIGVILNKVGEPQQSNLEPRSKSTAPERSAI
ncbi:MAG: AAA family ATPase, partial [Marinobacter sp.]|nr:AAA family ATPase [Marinobacter sp.]